MATARHRILYCSICFALATGPYSEASWSITDYFQQLWDEWWGAPEPQLTGDRDVLCGRLSNGLNYYIRPNPTSDNEVLLRLVVKGGSVVEAEHERGIAHFVEHLVFQGTESYSRDALEAWMRRWGMEWGPDVNAATHYEHTSYRFRLPTNDPREIAEGLHILSEMAAYATMDDESVEHERRVVLNELHARDGLELSSERRWNEAIFRNSPYETRHPGGLTSILSYCSPDTPRNYYKKWYRPELMAVVVVGDMDPAAIEAAVKMEFGRIPKSTDSVQLPNIRVPSQTEPQVVLETDASIREAQLRIAYKHPAPTQRNGDRQAKSTRPMSQRELYTFLVDRLFHDIMRYRFLELTEEGEAGFFAADSQLIHPIRNLDVYQVSAATTTELLATDLEILVSELRRISLHGFTYAELERARARQHRLLQRELRQVHQLNNNQLMDRYVSNFLYGKPLIDLKNALQRAIIALGTIESDEVSKWISYLYSSPENCVIWARIPARDRRIAPTKRTLRKAYLLGRFIDVEPFREPTHGLLNLLPQPGPRGPSVRQTLDHDISTWTLDNGMEVLFKPCGDQGVIVRAVAKGGLTSLEEDQWSAGRLATDLGNEWKMGGISNCELQRIYPGTSASLDARIFPCTRQLKASCEADELKQAFQLLNLAFTNTRCEEQAQSPALRRCWDAVYYAKHDDTPDFETSSRRLNTQNHPFYHRMTAADFDRMDLEWVKAYRRKSFRNPAEFTVIVTGNTTAAKVDALVQDYLAPIPRLRKVQTIPKTLPWTFPAGISTEQIAEEKEARSRVRLSYPVQRVGTAKELCNAKAAGWILHRRLNQILRHDLGLCYGVSVNWHSPLFPSFQGAYHSIDFSCDTEDVDQCMELIQHELQQLRQHGPHLDDMAMLKSSFVKRQPVEDRSPLFWSRILTSASLLGWDPQDLIDARQTLVDTDPQRLRSVFSQQFRERQYTLLVSKRLKA